MSKAGWYPQLAKVLLAQFNTNPTAEIRGTFSNIDDYVEHATTYNPYEFSLWVVDLVMQTTQYALHRPRMIVLYEIYRQSGLFRKQFSIKAF